MFTKLIHGLNLSSAILSAGLVIASSAPASALVINDNISIGRAELKAKCRRSGGTFKEQGNGVYLCVVENGDSTTVVACRRRKCDGIVSPHVETSPPERRPSLRSLSDGTSRTITLGD